jgi:hypothetical protein
MVMFGKNYMLEKTINSETICACLNLFIGSQMLPYRRAGLQGITVPPKYSHIFFIMQHKALTDLFGDIKTGHLKLFIRSEQEKDLEEEVVLETTGLTLLKRRYQKVHYLGV